MLTIDKVKDYVDGYLCDSIRKSMRASGGFPVSLIRLYEDNNMSEGWNSSLFNVPEDEASLGVPTMYFSQEDMDHYEQDIATVSHAPDTLGIISIIPVQELEVKGEMTGPLYMIIIHLKGWEKESDRSDIRLMHYSVAEMTGLLPGEDVYTNQYFDEYLAEYLVSRKAMPELAHMTDEQITEMFDKAVWPQVKPKFKEVVSNGMWGNADGIENPIDYPFGEEFAWNPLVTK
jgi:hypothetical protein